MLLVKPTLEYTLSYGLRPNVVAQTTISQFRGIKDFA